MLSPTAKPLHLRLQVLSHRLLLALELLVLASVKLVEPVVCRSCKGIGSGIFGTCTPCHGSGLSATIGLLRALALASSEAAQVSALAATGSLSAVPLVEAQVLGSDQLVCHSCSGTGRGLFSACYRCHGNRLPPA